MTLEEKLETMQAIGIILQCGGQLLGILVVPYILKLTYRLIEKWTLPYSQAIKINLLPYLLIPVSTMVLMVGAMAGWFDTMDEDTFALIMGILWVINLIIWEIGLRKKLKPLTEKSTKISSIAIVISYFLYKVLLLIMMAFLFLQI